MANAITIIGDGAMATVCSRLLSGKDCLVRLWSAFPEHAAAMRATGRNERFLPGVELPAGLEITTDPAEAFADAVLAVSAVPTQFTRAVWRGIRDHFPRHLPVCSVTKGIENDTLLRPTQVIADVLSRLAGPLAALSGPSIAGEVAAGLPATVVAASEDEALAERIQRLFTTAWFRVYTNSDLVGVELAGATKNVIAIAAGILDGLAVGDNAKAALLTRGLVEITRLGVALGGRRETFGGLAGLGDLVTTCVSPRGRNRSFGEAVGTGRGVREALAATNSVVEGVATTRSVVQLADRHDVEMPITRAVHAVLFEGQNPREAIAGLMTRRPKAEDEPAS
jgi:glycerol-3-phosphate dehydrogenase (NAD(P)+)